MHRFSPLASCFCYLLCVSCSSTSDAAPSGASLGVLVRGPENIDAVTLAVSNANIVGGVYGGILTTSRHDVEDFNSIKDAFVGLVGDDQVRAIVSLLPPKDSGTVAELAAEHRIAVVAPLGLTWWETQQEDAPFWTFGLSGPTVGAFAALGQFMGKDTDGALPCTSVGLVLEGPGRAPDIELAAKIAERLAFNYSGTRLLVDGSIEDPWSTVPSCIVVERGLHLEVTRAFRASIEAEQTTLVYIDLRDAQEFSADPELVGPTQGQLVLRSSNGPIEGRNVAAFEEMYVRQTDSRPQWWEGYYFDGALIASLGIATALSREGVRENIPLIATNTTMSATETFNPPVRVNGLPEHFSQGVSGFNGNGGSPDYRGVSGIIDYPGEAADERNTPEQEIRLFTINDFVAQDLTLMGRLNTTDTGIEFEFQ